MFEKFARITEISRRASNLLLQFQHNYFFHIAISLNYEMKLTLT